MVKYLIVGTGRCGTNSMRNLFDINGIKCGHENIFGVSKKQPNLTSANVLNRYNKNKDLKAESSWLAVPFLNTDLVPQHTTLIHVIRDPLKVIKSFLELDLFNIKHKGTEYVNHMFKHCPLLSYNNSQEVNLMLYYYYWNILIVNASANYNNFHTLRIEDGFSKIANNFSWKIQDVPVANKKVNKKVKKNITNQMIMSKISTHPMFNVFLDFCQKYNYLQDETKKI